MSAPAIRTDLTLRARYSEGAGIYRMIPEAVARVEQAGDLAGVVAWAKAAGLGITPRGAGSAMDGSSVGRGLVLDLTRFRHGQCDIDPVGRIARLAPSTTYGDLSDLAEAWNLRLPPNPSSGAWATLGGMASTNASGARTLKYGSIRKWVRSLTLETMDGPLDLSRGMAPDPSHPVIGRWHGSAAGLIDRQRAEILARFPKVRKNSAGYALDHYLDSGDLLDLVIGAEGTLGIITDLRVGLDAIPLRRASLRVAIGSRADLVPAIEAIRPHDPSTIEFLDASFLRLVEDRFETPEAPGLLRSAAGILLADFEGDDAEAVNGRARAAAEAARGHTIDTRIASDPREIERLWDLRHGASPVLAALSDGRRSLQVIEDGCVPPPRLAEYLDAIEAACGAARVDVVMFGHAGDGHVHVNLLPNVTDADWRERVRAVFASVSRAAVALGGTPSGEHGAGRLRASLLEGLYGREVMACFRAVKEAFDPDGCFNPGIILTDGADPFEAMKVGTAAALLPPGIAEYLRDAEAHARWGESRWT